MNGKTKNMVGLGLFSAIIVVVQLIFGSIRIGGVFSINPVLVPVVVGAAVYGWQAGIWLGLVSGAAILLSGEAAFFMAFHVAGTVLTVLVKGAACGGAAGLVYRLFCRRSRLLAVVCAAVACPLVNTGVFLLGCWVFFLEELAALSQGGSLFAFILTTFVGLNIFVELGINVVLSPVISRLVGLERRAS